MAWKGCLTACKIELWALPAVQALLEGATAEKNPGVLWNSTSCLQNAYPHDFQPGHGFVMLVFEPLVAIGEACRNAIMQARWQVVQEVSIRCREREP
jgi:hypothetical protein